MDGIHDMGGMHGFGAVPVADTSHGPDWGTRLQVIAMLSGRGMRPSIEALPPGAYLAAGYHEKWLLAAERSLVARGQLDEATLGRWRDLLRHDPEQMPQTANPAETARLETRVMTTPQLVDVDLPDFAVGQRVRVKKMRPEAHNRCPRYVRGAVGVINRIPGADYVPGAARSDDSVETVYTVAFDSAELWGERSATGEPGYELYIDLWQRYLEPA